jgi:uncharacterized repeat protein (TIGR03803 family)
MRSNDGNRSLASWGVFAALWAALIAAAGGSASAAPVETVLYSFTGDKEGGNPFASLIADSSGNLYGTASQGYPSNQGTVFKLSLGGTYTVLHAFAGGSDGNFPTASLIASSGNLYGTTLYGGGCSSCGVVFKLSPSGTYTVLHSFTGGSDGIAPYAGLIADSSGNLYGTTTGGGASGKGTVFKLSPSGTETVLHSFTGGSDGNIPFGGLIADSSGNLYGTTENGGASNRGVCSSSRRAGSRRCSTPLRAAATGLLP